MLGYQPDLVPSCCVLQPFINMVHTTAAAAPRPHKLRDDNRCAAVILTRIGNEDVSNMLWETSAKFPIILYTRFVNEM